MRETKAVIFDYYETLAELSTPMRERLFDGIAEGAGVQLQSGEAFRQWREEIVSDSAVRLAGVERPHPDGPVPPFVSFRDTWLKRFADLFRLWKVDEPPEAAADAYGQAHAKALAYPDVRPALDCLRGRFRVGLLADADRDFLDEGIALNALEFDAIVASEDVKVYKPHSSMFWTVCEQLEVSTDQAVYIGDRPWADIEGARHAGLEPVWINRGGASWPHGIADPGHVVTSVADLVDLLT